MAIVPSEASCSLAIVVPLVRLKVSPTNGAQCRCGVPGVLGASADDADAGAAVTAFFSPQCIVNAVNADDVTQSARPPQAALRIFIGLYGTLSFFFYLFPIFPSVVFLNLLIY